MPRHGILYRMNQDQQRAPAQRFVSPSPPPLPRVPASSAGQRKPANQQALPIQQQPLPHHNHLGQTQQQLVEHRGDARFQRELKEMKETEDLERIDDDVETAATLYEWHAQEHEHRPKSPAWFAVLAAGTTGIVVILLLLANFIGAIAIALLGALTYHIAQKKPATVRYRIMVDGVAINNALYHYRDVDTFNIVYIPGEVKMVILRSKHRFAPLIHMEIGEADPVEIREILLEFLPENQDLEEPLVDILARRLGF